MRKETQDFQRELLGWYKEHGRDLPWRHTSDPYYILVSEIMLQQTQVDRVLPKYLAWLDAFPTLASLAKASAGDVLRLWSGLGYNSRALRLKKVAEYVLQEGLQTLPSTREELRQLPGVGAYTSGAIMAFAHGADVSFLDTNIKRILHRVFVGPEFQGWQRADREMEALAEQVMPLGQSYAYHQALMDLGATLCKATAPKCVACPLQKSCATQKVLAFEPWKVSEKRVAYKKSHVPFKQSRRYIRGGILKYLQSNEGKDFSQLLQHVQNTLRPMEAPELLEILADLKKEGLVHVVQGHYHLGS